MENRNRGQGQESKRKYNAGEKRTAKAGSWEKGKKEESRGKEKKGDIWEKGKKTDIREKGKKTDIRGTEKKTDMRERGKKTDIREKEKKTDIREKEKKTDIWEKEKKTDIREKGKKAYVREQRNEKRAAAQEERKPAQKQQAGKICHAFGDCGGCQLLGVPYEEQLKGKKRDLARLLKPYVKLEGMIGMEEPQRYRNKVNAAFTHDRNGKPLSGVYKEGTHYIIPIEECVLENEKADEIIGSIRGLLPSFKIKTYDEDSGYGLLRHVMVRVGHVTGQIMVVLVLGSPVMPSKNNFVKALLKLHPEITTIVVNVNDRKTSMVLGDKEQVIYGKGYIEDVLCGITFKISPKSFYQVNSVQTEKLYGKAMEYAGLTGKETVLDAYCGIGTIGMVAARRAERVIGVELNRDAVKDAVANAKKNDIGNIDFYQKDAGEFMQQLAGQGERIDTVFMDPPRSGSDEVFLDSLAILKPKKVVYISCNPEALVRDLDFLVKKGYHVERGVGVDMFPFCGHVEVICCLSRIKGFKL